MNKNNRDRNEMNMVKNEKAEINTAFLTAYY